MSSTTVTADLTIADQDIFAITSPEWNTYPSSLAPESIYRTSSSTPEPIDKISSTSDTKAQEQQQQQQQQLESDSEQTDAEYDIGQDRQFQKFLHRFGGSHKLRS
ncbi:hypothetical protein BGX24_008423 [Mortierella sp. AD032]|nr:hypothetical protein BGX24_008423 [Mortierella sp. AD032]